MAPELTELIGLPCEDINCEEMRHSTTIRPLVVRLDPIGPRSHPIRSGLKTLITTLKKLVGPNWQTTPTF
jgi:hypothetical protein